MLGAALFHSYGAVVHAVLDTATPGDNILVFERKFIMKYINHNAMIKSLTGNIIWFIISALFCWPSNF